MGFASQTLFCCLWFFAVISGYKILLLSLNIWRSPLCLSCVVIMGTWHCTHLRLIRFLYWLYRNITYYIHRCLIWPKYHVWGINVIITYGSASKTGTVAFLSIIPDHNRLSITHIVAWIGTENTQLRIKIRISYIYIYSYQCQYFETAVTKFHLFLIVPIIEPEVLKIKSMTLYLIDHWIHTVNLLPSCHDQRREELS